jgi:hypothetical protein
MSAPTVITPGTFPAAALSQTCRPGNRLSLKCPTHQPSLLRHSLPAPPPASVGWQQPHRGCPFKSLPPWIVWTNQGPSPPLPNRQLAPPTSPQKCEGHLKGQQRGSQVSYDPHPLFTPSPPTPTTPFPKQHSLLPLQRAPQIPVLSPPLETARRRKGARDGGRGAGGSVKRTGTPSSLRTPGDSSKGKEDPGETARQSPERCLGQTWGAQAVGREERSQAAGDG